MKLAVFKENQLKNQTGEIKALRRDDTIKHLTDVPNGPLLILRAAPHSDAIVLAYLSQAQINGCILSSEKACEWYRVPTQEGRYGWVKSNSAEFSSTPSSLPVALKSLRYEISPPKITLDESPLSVKVDTEQVTISGKVESVEELRDLMIYVNQRKVFFLPRTEMANPRGVAFSADIPLEGGVNHITIYARLSEEISDVASVFIYRPKDQSKTKDDKK
jgi:hypothetical protein